MSIALVWVVGFAAALAIFASIFATRQMPADSEHVTAALILAAVWPLFLAAVLYVMWAEDRVEK